MSSILTNASALSAVANLAATQKSLATVQNQISTGLKVSSAQDNAAYYSIATTLRTNVGNLGAVSDSLNLGKSVIGTATAALSGITKTLQTISDQLVAANQPGADKDAINTQIQALAKQLNSAISSASFNNVNLLDGTTTGTVKFVAGVSGAGTADADISTLDLTASDTDLSANNTAVTGISISSTSSADDLKAALDTVGTALTAANKASSALGSLGTQIDQQSTFTSALSDSLTTGIGSLVDADLNEASTRLNALQTQQQLGVQALSVANQNSQIILKLFQG